jgi:hypothetical protein
MPDRKAFASKCKESEKPITDITLIPHLEGKAKAAITNEVNTFCQKFIKSVPDFEKYNGMFTL